MRLVPNSKRADWNRISKSTKWFSIFTAVIVIVANTFPVGALWIPETLNELGTTVAWFVVPAVGWALIVSGLAYWATLYWIVPLFHSGQDFVVDRTPLIFYIEGEYMQMAEVNEQGWKILERTESGGVLENGNAVPMDNLDIDGRQV
jgi:hypothetical protein